MAFVSRAQRQLHTVTNSGIGPGAYINQSHYASNPSFAPFTSTSERNITKILVNTTTPGPGSYLNNISHISNKSIDHWGHPKHSAPFASGLGRFQYKKAPTSPGPGTYSVQESWKGKNKKPKIQGNINWARTPSAPSIPANHQTFGYDEGDHGELIMQKNPEEVHSGDPNNSVGPGHYSVTDLKKSRGPKWHKTTEKREIFTTPTTGPELGPGSYSESRLNIVPMYKFKENAVFASAIKETTCDPSKETALGPGSYNIEKFSSFSSSKKKVPTSLQNFGSNSIRFNKKHNEYDVGPGQYNAASSMVSLSNSRVESRAPFSSTNARFHYVSNLTPGPGAYSGEDFAEKNNKKAYSRQGVFGSSERRLPFKTALQTPGPGYYPDTAKKVGASNTLQSKPSAVFVSKSVKGSGKIQKTDAPAPGSYEIPSKLGAKRPPANSMHPVLSRISKSQVEGHPGFASRADRFDRDVSVLEPTPGPGSYEPAVKNKKKKVIVGKEERFKEGKKSEIPGPGAYCNEPGEWNKKSYNVLFSDIA